MGLAYLPDGSLIDYKEYIEKHPHWQKVRTERFKFDGGRCVVCHRDLTGKTYQTHHLLFAHPDAAHQTVKFCAPDYCPGKAPGNHENPCEQDENEEGQGRRKKRLDDSSAEKGLNFLCTVFLDQSVCFLAD